MSPDISKFDKSIPIKERTEGIFSWYFVFLEYLVYFWPQTIRTHKILLYY